MSGIKMDKNYTITNNLLDELDEIHEEGGDSSDKKEGELAELMESLKSKNRDLLRENEKLKEKNKKMGEQVKRLHEMAKKNADQIMASEDKIDVLEEEVESLKEKLALTEKEMEMYKKKLKTQEEEKAKNLSSEGKLTQVQKMLEEKNKKIVDLEIQIKSLQIKNRKSFRDLSKVKPEPAPKIMVSSSVSIHKKNNDKKLVTPQKTKIDEESLPLDLMWDIDLLKKKQEQDNKKKQENSLTPKSSNTKSLSRRKSQRDAMKDLNNIDFGIKQPSKMKPKVNPFDMFDSKSKIKSQYGRKNKGVNSKIFEKSKQLKKMIKKPTDRFGESSSKKKLVYSYDHLNIVANYHLTKIIEENEGIYLQSMSSRLNFKCLSDNVYRLNKWKNKKPKILIITSRFLYIVTPPHEIKRILNLSQIKKVYTRGRQDNFVCFLTKSGNDEMLDYFKKNELLLYLTSLIKKKNLDIRIKTNVESFQMVTTENKKLTIDPNKLQKFKPIYNNTFNYASERNRLMNISIWKEGFFGLSEKFERRVALITDLGILLFSNVQWDLERFVPFGG